MDTKLRQLALLGYRPKRSSKTAKLPYSAQGRLIAPAELRFLHCGLQPAIESRFYIGVQVRMTAVLKVDPVHWDKAAGRTIRQNRLDFVLAHPRTFKIAAVIELDDLSHQPRHRKQRDRFVDEAFDAAGVLLICIPSSKNTNQTRFGPSSAVIFGCIVTDTLGSNQSLDPLDPR